MRAEFEVHLLNEEGIQKANEIAQIFSDALDEISKRIPAGRNLSLVVTKMQEASFFAKRGIAEQVENQKK